MNLRICSVMQQVKQVTLYKRSGEVKQHSKVKWLIIFNLRQPHSEQLEWRASFVSILQCVYVCVHCMIMCMQLWGVGSCEHQLMLLVVFRFCSCIVTQGYIQNKLSKGNTCQLSYSNTKLNSIFFFMFIEGWCFNRRDGFQLCIQSWTLQHWTATLLPPPVSACKTRPHTQHL